MKVEAEDVGGDDRESWDDIVGFALERFGKGVAFTSDELWQGVLLTGKVSQLAGEIHGTNPTRGMGMILHHHAGRVSKGLTIARVRGARPRKWYVTDVSQ